MTDKNHAIYRDLSINATDMPTNMARALTGRGISTVGALMDSDAYKAVTSGRYDIEMIREVNGIPIGAISWLVNAFSAAV